MIAMTAMLYTKWIKALRSGRYKQGFGQLRIKLADRSYAYCPLGLLCNVRGLKWIEDYGNRFGNKDRVALRNKSIDGLPFHFKRASYKTDELPDHFEPVKGNWFDFDYLLGAFDRNKVKVPEGLKLPVAGNIPGLYSIAGLNDSRWTFNQIADFIELNKDQLVEIIK